LYVVPVWSAAITLLPPPHAPVRRYTSYAVAPLTTAQFTVSVLQEMFVYVGAAGAAGMARRVAAAQLLLALVPQVFTPTTQYW
jgi:hypothetical protein